MGQKQEGWFYKVCVALFNAVNAFPITYYLLPKTGQFLGFSANPN